MCNPMKFIKYITAVLLLLNTAILAEQNNQLVQHDLIQERTIIAREYFNIGSSFLRLKKYQEAIEYFNIAIKYSPGYAPAYNGKGIARY
ncbi:tetratricopeptide repeat protein [Orientia tsutsugamushi]|uniref:tetratricopeptide repeat protein n=1 Tax=Orientia tsutsugamushi TaxID=784 RepID=UPI00315DA82E